MQKGLLDGNIYPNQSTTCAKDSSQMDMLRTLALAAVMAAASINAHASENIIRILAPISGSAEWALSESTVSVWANTGGLYDCGTQAPLASSIPTGLTFTQTFSGCSQDQERSIQKNRVNRHTGELQAYGSPATERQVLKDQQGSAQLVGTRNVETFNADIVAGILDGNRAVGYRRQIGGVYSFGTSMTGNGSLPVTAGFVYYAGAYGLAVIAGTENLGAADWLDTTEANYFLSSYTRVNLLSSDGVVQFSYALRAITCQRGYCARDAIITPAEFSRWYAQPSLVTRVQLVK